MLLSSSKPPAGCRRSLGIGTQRVELQQQSSMAPPECTSHKWRAGIEPERKQTSTLQGWHINLDGM